MIKYSIILLTSVLALNAYAGLFDFFDFSEDPKVEPHKASTYTNAQPISTVASAEPDFSLATSPQLHYETIVKDSEYLKSHYEELTLILKSFASLERNLKGYEERKVVSNLKNYFKDKYLLNQADLIEIRNNLNEVINK